MTPKVELVKNANGEWFWHIEARNMRLQGTSGEPFHSKGNAKRAAVRMIEALRDGVEIWAEGELIDVI
jgi:uncharacterized protein YegP (UPF0339 family)